MKKIGFNNTKDEEPLTCRDFIENQKDKIIIKDIEKDISKIILEYCDARLYPMRNGQERDDWFLDQIRKVRIRYLEEI